MIVLFIYTTKSLVPELLSLAIEDENTSYSFSILFLHPSLLCKQSKRKNMADHLTPIFSTQTPKDAEAKGLYESKASFSQFYFMKDNYIEWKI